MKHWMVWFVAGSLVLSAQVSATPSEVFPSELIAQKQAITPQQQSWLSQIAKERFAASCDEVEARALIQPNTEDGSEALRRIADIIVVNLSGSGYMGPGRFVQRGSSEVFSFQFSKRGEGAVVGEVMMVGTQPMLYWCWVAADAATR